MNRAIYILHISLPSLHDYDAKIPNFTSLEDVDTRQQLSYSFSELSLRSKRFRLVSEQRKTEERDSRFWPREK